MTTQETPAQVPALIPELEKPIVESGFGNDKGFIVAQRIAAALAASTVVPEAYRGNVANCLVALEMSYRVGCSPLAVMQNLYLISGKPGWLSQFVIAIVNNSKRFSPLMFKLEGEGVKLSCYAWAKNGDGDVVEGPKVTWAMAEGEGWTKRAGSKWLTMPEVMIRYRAAAFFGRLYCPDLLIGMHTDEEIIDAEFSHVRPEVERAAGTSSLKSKIAATVAGQAEPAQAAPVEEIAGDMFGSRAGMAE